MSTSLIALTLIPLDCESIREFTRRIDRSGIHSQPGLWNQRLRAAGYYSAELGLSPFTNWQHVHDWCCDQFGEDHYVWTGSTFWFETEQAAVLFALRWT
jgi:hypothetical protein